MTKLKPKLRAYQKEGIAILSEGFAKGHRAWLLCDETGLGKTNQSLYTAKNIMKTGEHGKVLICCPAALRPKWILEIKKWLPEKRNWSIIITTFSEIINVSTLQYLTKYKYDFLIIDESHYVKSFEAQRTLAIYGEPGCQYKPLVKVCKQFIGYWQCKTLSQFPIKQN